MMDYLLIVHLHIVFAGIWLVNFISDIFLRGFINKNKNKTGEKKLVSFYLSFTNLFGMIGSIGILITGILIITQNSGFGFFQMTANHWLTTKQLLMVVLLLVIGSLVIPTAKKVRTAIGNDLENQNLISTDGYSNLQKLFKINTVINIIVLINFLLAITHRYFS
jgi:hypothetical protein